MNVENNQLNLNGLDTVPREIPDIQPASSEIYNDEQLLENYLIEILKSQGYEYAKNIKKENALVENFRKKIEELNGVQFSDSEWNRFYKQSFLNKHSTHSEKTKLIQELRVIDFRFDDDNLVNIKLIDLENILNNKLQVINQFRSGESGDKKSRYDTTILVNGLPLVHIELKRSTKKIEEAFHQINRYINSAFDRKAKLNDGSEVDSLFEFVQLFIISNGKDTKYYSNSTRKEIIETNKNHFTKVKRADSFEFTNYWADINNNLIKNINIFARTFLLKKTLLEILTKYCVVIGDDKNAPQRLIVMRPYQIAATQLILQRISDSINKEESFPLSTPKAGGYIWHSTGSGKTLTSFKAATLAYQISSWDNNKKDNSAPTDKATTVNSTLEQNQENNQDKKVDLVFLVVDRKDLDHQTQIEFNKYESGRAIATGKSSHLDEMLKQDNSYKKIIIITIQKLNEFIKKNPTHNVYDKHCVFIFDECHRSQFGTMHKNITDHFKRYNLFGFTGTPIFKPHKHNQSLDSKEKKRLKAQDINETTEDLFGKCLHTYSIINAIEDKNVLPFKVEIINTFKGKDDITDTKVEDIDTKAVWLSKERVTLVAKHIVDNFNNKTHKNTRSRSYSASEVNSSFNSIFTVESIQALKKYYLALTQLGKSKDLKVAAIYSLIPNKGSSDWYIMDDEDTFEEGKAYTSNSEPSAATESSEAQRLEVNANSITNDTNTKAPTTSNSQEQQPLESINAKSVISLSVNSSSGRDELINEDQSSSATYNQSNHDFTSNIDKSEANYNSQDLQVEFSKADWDDLFSKADLDDLSFFEKVISKDYAEHFKIKAFKATQEDFDLYYKDVATRVRDNKIDILLVVNMFLTGFDAPRVNTLWVDRELREHGLIQAFSRTNRILNKEKLFGNIVCYRNLESQIVEAIQLYSNGNIQAEKQVLVQSYPAMLDGFTNSSGVFVPGYKTQVKELLTDFNLNQWDSTRDREFIKKYGVILKTRFALRSSAEYHQDWNLVEYLLQLIDPSKLEQLHQLKDSGADLATLYDDAYYTSKGINLVLGSAKSSEVDTPIRLIEYTFDEYTRKYLDLYDEDKVNERKRKKVDIIEDLRFEIDYIKSFDLDVGYITWLIGSMIEQEKRTKVKVDWNQFRQAVDKKIMTSTELRSKRELIKEFIASLTPEIDVNQQWNKFNLDKLRQRVYTVIDKYKLNPDKTFDLMKKWLDNNEVQIYGTSISNLLTRAAPMISNLPGISSNQPSNFELTSEVSAELKEIYNEFAGNLDYRMVHING